MGDNVVATIIFILAMIGVVALVIYKLRKENNDKITIEDFLDIYQDNLFNVLQDVIYLLSIDIKDFVTKEEYERAIISTTIKKLEENCDEFGISSALLKLVDKELLANVLYDILYTNKVQLFFSSLPERIVKNNSNLYDKEVIDAFKNADPVINEENNTDESQEEPKDEEEEVIKQEETIVDAPNDEKNEESEENDGQEITAEFVFVPNEYNGSEIAAQPSDEDLPPRELYYGTDTRDKLDSEDAFEVEFVNDIIIPSSNEDEIVSE